MELVHGPDFLRFVRPIELRAFPELKTRSMTPMSVDDSAASEGLPKTRQSTKKVCADAPTSELQQPSVPTALPGGTAGLDFDRLHGALHQLVEGLTTLHQHGKIHRDVKPSNLLVDDKERLVILDFGLVRAITTASARRTSEGAPLEGTPTYVSPEQMMGGELGPSSDWYAVSILLYQTLVGHLPWRGSFDL